jgi:tRNA(Ile)-lysidine synthase
VVRSWLRNAGVPDLQAVHLGAVDALLTRWRGQGRVDLPGGHGVLRSSGRLRVLPAPDAGDAAIRTDEPPEEPRP